MADMSDIDRAVSLIDEHNGTGEWVNAAEGKEILRWNFPRFKGAKADEDKYLSRPGIGSHDSDVEMVASWLDAPRKIVGGVMLLGNPGTGKTSLAQAAATHAGLDYSVLTATPDHTKDSLLTRFVGDGRGEDGSAFVKGPVAKAAEDGTCLIVDEFMLLVDGVKPIFYPLLDGNEWLPEGNVDGTPLRIHQDTRVIVTSNPGVRGASLPEPIGSRFASTTLTVETSASLLEAMELADEVIEAWRALGTAKLWRPEVRELRLANYWMGVDDTQAVSAFLPEHCPESQRVDVRDVVINYFGGDIRKDGRLVVA